MTSQLFNKNIITCNRKQLSYSEEERDVDKENTDRLLVSGHLLKDQCYHFET